MGHVTEITENEGVEANNCCATTSERMGVTVVLCALRMILSCREHQAREPDPGLANGKYSH